MKTGLVSVMMPAYNAEVFIGEALESLVRQEYSDWELIVINDGSTDGTSEVLGQYPDPRIQVCYQENGGEAAARNSALARLRGEFVAFLDADDIFLPQHIALAVRYLNAHPEHDAVYTDGYHIDAEGRQLDRISRYRRGPFVGRIFEEVVRASDVFGPPTCVVLRRGRISSRDLTFDPRIIIGPDWDFLTRFAESVDFGYLAEATCLYRVHPDSTTHATEPDKRLASLALCREKAIRLSGFPACSPEVRGYAFYDLLVNLLPGEPDRQAAITRWPQFDALPAVERARLFRLMAGRAVLRGENSKHVGEWFRSARLLRPADLRNVLLASVYSVSPALCRLLLLVRQRAQHRVYVRTAFGVNGQQDMSLWKVRDTSSTSGLSK